MITAIKCITKKFAAEHLKDIKIYAAWDNHEHYDIETNFGTLFGNEAGFNKTSYMLAGIDADGEYYCYYPMPYLENAKIEIENCSDKNIEFSLVSVSTTCEYNELYKTNKFGYFSSSKYYERKCTHGSDSIIAEESGKGHIVSSVITGYGIEPDGVASCEGDVRIHFNSVRTPQIESDGSESYACYGWGFETPPQINPSSGYDGFFAIPGHAVKLWSMCRHLMGDWYPYRNGFRFGIESGFSNDMDMEHSGCVFFYNTRKSNEYTIGTVSDGGNDVQGNVAYSRLSDDEITTETSFFEGDDDDIEVTLSGYYGGDGSMLAIKFDADTDQIILRRVSNQRECRQLAEVYIDGVKIEQYPWYFPDHNPYKSWLEDEYIIPKKYIGGKEKIEVKIIPQEC